MKELPQEIRQRLLKLKKVISEKFNSSNWEELGLLLGCTQIVKSENRLFQSLYFGDDDYEGHVISVLEKIATKDQGLVEEIERYVASNFEIGETGVVDGIFCRPKVFSCQGIKQEDDLVAIMMPFSAEFAPVFDAIREGVASVGLRALRANDIWNDSTIIQDIFSLIAKSRIVVCDFSGKNPNVFYEAGIAHTLGRDVVPLAQCISDIPFDLKHHRALSYLPNTQGLKELSQGVASRIRTLCGGKTAWEF